MRFLALLSLVAVAAAHSEHLEPRSQPGAAKPTPVDLRPLQWGDLNVISTTDTHGWLSGHVKEGSYSGDFGDFSSFLSHMREQAGHRRKDLLVVDSGGKEEIDGPPLFFFPQRALSNRNYISQICMMATVFPMPPPSTVKSPTPSSRRYTDFELSIVQRYALLLLFNNA